MSKKVERISLICTTLKNVELVKSVSFYLWDTNKPTGRYWLPVLTWSLTLIEATGKWNNWFTYWLLLITKKTDWTKNVRLRTLWSSSAEILTESFQKLDNKNEFWQFLFRNLFDTPQAESGVRYHCATFALPAAQAHTRSKFWADPTGLFILQMWRSLKVN